MGTGPGSGIALLFVAAAILQTLVLVIAFSVPAIRNVEDIIPDHQERLEQPFDSEEQVDQQPEQQPVV